MASHRDARPPTHRSRARRGLSGWLDEFARKRIFQRLIKHTNNFDKVSWMGVGVWQNVLDLWTIQETIAEIRPDVLIETGTNRGGSAHFYGHLFDTLYPGDTSRGRIWTVDIEKLHEITHPRVTYALGSSTSPDTLGALQRWIGPGTPNVMVILDSDHNRAHVRAELEAYAPLVSVGSYLLCQDGVIDDLAMLHRNGEQGPRRAIEDFFRTSALADRFEIDEARCERFLLTHHPKGWLKRIKN